jgi:hypothetical protein
MVAAVITEACFAAFRRPSSCQATGQQAPPWADHHGFLGPRGLE